MARALNKHWGTPLAVAHSVALAAALHFTALPAAAAESTAPRAETNAESSATPPATENAETETPPAAAKPRLPGFLKWLDPDLNRARLATDLPVRDLPRGHATALEELGRVVFRSPATLGGWAGKAGMSCDTCHQNGSVNKGFRLPPYSGAAGKIDMTQRRFSARGDDGVFNPRPIPDLRSARAPYGTLNPQNTLEAFIHYTITEEFGGPAPAPILAKALAAYLRALPEAAKAAPEDDPLYRKLHKDKGTSHYVRVTMDDLDRTLFVLETAALSKRPDIGAFVAEAARQEIARLYFRLDANDPGREDLRLMATQIKQIPAAMDGKNFVAAAKMARALRARMALLGESLIARADLTYFNRVRLTYYLKPEMLREIDDKTFVPLGGVEIPPEEPEETPDQPDRPDQYE